MENVAICIIARMASSRLPRKVIAKVARQALVSHIIDKMKESNIPGVRIVLCTTNLEEDDPLVEIADEHNIRYVRGSVESVVDRMYKAADLVDADTLVRVTGDNIFTDVILNDYLIEKHWQGSHEYSRYFGLPNGVTTEVVSLEALRRCYSIHNKDDSEYMTLHLNDPECFDVLTVYPESKLNASDINLSVDTSEDLERTKLLYEHSCKKNLLHIIEFVRDNNIESAKIAENGTIKLIDKEVSYYEYKSNLQELANKSTTLKMNDGWYEKQYSKYFR